MYFAGILLIFLGALLVNKLTGHKFRKSFFIIELPEYKVPSLKRAALSMLSRGKAYIVKAGTIILVCNAAVQIMQSFNWQLQVVEEGMEHTSILASLASPFGVLLIPVGFGVWQLAAAAITGFIAKENVVGTLAVVYGLTNFIDTEELALVGSGNEVAAVMSAKAENINGVFEAEALIELPSTEGDGATWYTDVPALKKRMNIFNVNQLCCWPKVKLGDRVFDYTVQLAGSMSKTDNSGEFGDGTPCESASNKVLRADSMVLANGEEVRLDVPKANYLNDNGIITCVNFYNGFVSWGNYTSAFPANTDPVDYFYIFNRMFKYIAKTVILTSWNDVDRRITRRLLDAIMQGVNYWLNSLTAEEKILGGRVEMLESENALTNLMAGRVKFHIYVTPPSPLQQLDWVMEYDLSYLQVLLSPAA